MLDFILKPGRLAAWERALRPGAVGARPAPISPLLHRLARAACRQRFCSLEAHLALDGTDSCAWCGTAVQRSPWVLYAVQMRDGGKLVRNATSAAHAQDMVIYGELMPGLPDFQAKAQGRHRIHPSHVVGCVLVGGPAEGSGTSARSGDRPQASARPGSP